MCCFAFVGVGWRGNQVSVTADDKNCLQVKDKSTFFSTNKKIFSSAYWKNIAGCPELLSKENNIFKCSLYGQHTEEPVLMVVVIFS